MQSYNLNWSLTWITSYLTEKNETWKNDVREQLSINEVINSKSYFNVFEKKNFNRLSTIETIQEYAIICEENLTLNVKMWGLFL